MTEINVRWTMENIWEFVKFNSFRKNRTIKITFVLLICCYGLILGLCLASFIVLNNLAMLVVAAALTLLVAGYAFVFYRMLKKYAKRFYEANGDDENTNVRFSDELILVLKNGEPIGQLSWSAVGGIYFNDEKGAAYIMTRENALGLAEYSQIVSGTKEELKKLLEAKDAELSKKA